MAQAPLEATWPVVAHVLEAVKGTAMPCRPVAGGTGLKAACELCAASELEARIHINFAMNWEGLLFMPWQYSRTAATTSAVVKGSIVMRNSEDQGRVVS